MKKEELKFCENCGKKLVPIYPPVEECVEYKFTIKIPFTDWKFVFLKDSFEYGCPSCLAEEEMERRRENYREIYYDGMRDGYEKALEKLN